MPALLSRSALLLTLLATALHVAAAPRFWTLTGVRFNQSGTFATGYFSYDDATQEITDWNVQVNDPFAVPFPAFSYVPGNSAAYALQLPNAPAIAIILSAAMRVPGPYFGKRQLQIAPLAALDGAQATVPLDFLSREDFENASMGRWVTAGSLALTRLAPPVVIVQVDEFYHAALGHYFITASDAEKSDLDNAVHAGWVRTGESFKAYASGSAPRGLVNPVCRFYSAPENDDWPLFVGADSHFYSADAGECLTVFRKYASVAWTFESDNVFQINLPDKASGACPDGTMPVYRLWNQRADSNHRYTTSAAIKVEMLAAGYLAEGYGADGVAMCALR